MLYLIFLSSKSSAVISDVIFNMTIRQSSKAPGSISYKKKMACNDTALSVGSSRCILKPNRMQNTLDSINKWLQEISVM
ncbi:conserved hypothetical protein [Trichinella spiralis]|uniref:hypothetical protein n=1 Tax=Trichinella spiralis TaxID=6334 RepID=UPI0001EFE3C0|nr:conserved hypothetical protein [Trichinella spiralis]